MKGNWILTDVSKKINCAFEHPHLIGLLAYLCIDYEQDKNDDDDDDDDCDDDENNNNNNNYNNNSNNSNNNNNHNNRKLFVINTVLFVNLMYSFIINLLKNIATIFTYCNYWFQSYKR